MIPEASDLMVLDVLELIKAEHDSTVTYRRSCREGVCGSDGLNINGKNGLACITPLSEVCAKISSLYDHCPACLWFGIWLWI